MSAAHSQTPEILVVGHISLDVVGEETQVGGSVAYAGTTLAALGHSIGAVTSMGPEVEWKPTRRLSIENIRAEESTSFENQYTPEGRRQILHRRAVDLDIDMVPKAWQSAPVVLLAPIADEVDPTMAKSFPNSWIALSPQGWLRRWNAAGEVEKKKVEAIDRLPRGRMVFLSTEDIDEEESWIDRLAERYRWFILTDGENGAKIYHEGQAFHSPAPKVNQVDPTGAGDIFAACFISRYRQTKDYQEAARFANQLAAISVTRSGLESVPTQEEIEEARKQANL
jgi:sugar/nucleoside kinase (ribokinase family)